MQLITYKSVYKLLKIDNFALIMWAQQKQNIHSSINTDRNDCTHVQHRSQFHKNSVYKDYVTFYHTVRRKRYVIFW